MGKTVFRFGGFSNNSIACSAVPRIIAKTNSFGDSGTFFQEIDMAYIIEIYHSVKLFSPLIRFCRSVVGTKHDVSTPNAYFVRQLKLRERATVGAKTFFFQHLKDRRVRAGLHREVVLEAPGYPVKGLIHVTGCFPDSLFIIEMKGGWNFSRDFF